MATPRKQEGVGARALEFANLTAARSDEVRGGDLERLRSGQRAVGGAGRANEDEAGTSGAAVGSGAMELMKAQMEISLTDFALPPPKPRQFE